MSHTSFKKNCTYLSHGTSCNDLKWCPARQVWKKLSKLSPWNFMAFMVRLKWDISVSFSSHITMNNISVSFLRLISHCNALANISVSSTSHTTVASFRRLTHWQKPWHQYTPHTPHFIFTRVQPTIWMYGRQPVCACIKFIFSLNFRRCKNENSQSQERRRALCQQC